MKTVLIIISANLFLVINCRAQTVEYDTCNLQYYNKFEGNWIYINGADTIRITLRKHRFQYQNQPPGSTTIDVMDKLFGWHEYKQGSNVIESNYAFRNISLPLYDFPHGDSVSIGLSFIRGTCSDTTRKLKGNITDYSQSDEVKQVWITLSPDGNTLYWKQEHSEGFGAFTGAYGMTLPRQFTLTRE
jgi:hypothetical protein